VFHATFNNISVISWGQFYLWRKGVPGETTDRLQVTETLSPNVVSSTPRLRFWTYIKHKKSDKSGVAPLRKNGRLETDPINKANILNEQFQSVFSPSTNIDREEF
jgi:hypothetical protein